ncbi:hypothetical protein [Streptomyces sp. NPDC051014]|uniref:hypothetical protein n=1 Tax=Streptomyces sp. NPDC051014 TaxID=3155751 RepID=UPI0033C184D5
MLSVEHIERVIRESTGPKIGPVPEVTQEHALFLLMRRLEGEGIFFSEIYPMGLEELYRFASSRASDVAVRRFARYLMWINFASSRLGFLAASARDQIRALRAGGGRCVDFMVVEFAADAPLPSFACFGEHDLQVAIRLGEFGLPVHEGRVAKADGGRPSSLTNHGVLDGCETLSIHTASDRRDLIEPLVQAVSPKKNVTFRVDDGLELAVRSCGSGPTPDLFRSDPTASSPCDGTRPHT